MSVTDNKVTYTSRLLGFVTLGGFLALAGILFLSPVLIVAAIINFVFIFVGLIHSPTELKPNISVEISVNPHHPRPGDTVSVEVAVTNGSQSTFPDIRAVSFVPNDLRVVNGTARSGKPLRPGDTLTLTYDVIARRGVYKFNKVRLRSRSALGSVWTESTIQTDGGDVFDCAVRADNIPLEDKATHFVGNLLSDQGGEGIELHSTREYHRGDAPNRINWRDLAKTGELSTISYRENQAAEVAIILDAREVTRIQPNEGEPSGLVLGGYAAYQLTSTLINQGHYVSLTIPGLDNTPESEGSDALFPYRRYESSRGRDQRRHAFKLLEELDETNTTTGDVLRAHREVGAKTTIPMDDPSNPLTDEPPLSVIEFINELKERETDSSQFIVITPLLDGASFQVITYLRRVGYPVTVVSPNITPSRKLTDVGKTIGKLQRATRIEALRKQSITTIDWNPSVSLSEATEKQTLPGQT